MNDDYEVQIRDIMGDLMWDGVDEERARALAEEQVESNLRSEAAWRERMKDPAWRELLGQAVASYGRREGTR